MATSHNRGNPFPNRTPSNSRKTSDAVPAYNCFGWAIVGEEILFGPAKAIGWEWPSSAPFSQRLASVIAAAAEYRFVRCDDGEAEEGYEKIVLFGSGDCVEHAARQLKNGRWTSELGRHGEDIEHDSPEVVAGGGCGSVLAFLKRTVRGAVEGATPDG